MLTQLTLFPIKARRCRACKKLFQPITDNQRFCDWLCDEIYQLDKRARRRRRAAERRANTHE